ncbi:MAG: zf-HC2 domain-containing protein [Gemmatimonadetes bacterium]|nr:zf-HC2 domain-containing protein [Gemmatimonadota bacterium]
MTLKLLSNEAHLTDGDLLRFSDGECGAQERAQIAAHIAGCEQCAEASRFFTSITSQLNVSLDDLVVDPPADAKQRVLAAARSAKPIPQRRPVLRRQALLRAAVVAFALVAAGMWAAPVRAWFAELLGVDRPEPVETAPAPERAALPQASLSSTVSFVPTAATFVIDLSANQAAGTLTLAVHDGAQASARITDGGPTDALFVTGNGIRISNAPTSSATYTITVPANVQEVQVLVGGVVAGTYSVSSIAAQDGVVVDIAG